jgi:DGQHR domain-containing protein
MKISALRVQQPLGEFFISVLPADALVDRVNNRPRSSGVEKSEDIQRIFSDKRVNEITEFCRDPQATFPTPVILALDSKIVKEINIDGFPSSGISNQIVFFEIPDDGIIGDVLDGQHRVLGLRNSPKRKEFELPVVFMFDLSLDDKAFVFSIINSKQTPVSGSLIYDLFDLSKFRSPQKTCHYIAQALNSTEGSPFFGRLRMLGRREGHHAGGKMVMLSQGSFAARLQELISKNEGEDTLRLKDGTPLDDDARCPLRKYFQKEDDESILKIVSNFFTAASDTFSAEWSDNEGKFIIRKTVGYTGLIIVLRHLIEDGFAAKDLSLPFFKEKFSALKENLGDIQLTSDNFPSSGAGAIKLAKTLLALENLKYPINDAVEIEDVRLEA